MASWANIRLLRQCPHSQRPKTRDIPPNWRCCVALVLSPLRKTEDGHHWAESKIKALTGGDPVSARFMRQDFFTYQPSFKLIVAGNHRPSLRNVDEAIRRRFNLLPFTVTIPPAERDPSLAEKLKEEWSGILAWAIEGCLEWQRIGLAPPSAVTKATEDYLSEEDAVGQFISECCERHPQAQAQLKDLYAAY